MIAHRMHGNGSESVLIMHDWFCDSSSYDAVLPYLDTDKFTYAFVDLRGYGQSKGMGGRYDVAEAADDVLKLCAAIGFKRFHVVGHSMSGMIAQYMAHLAPTSIKSVFAITPVPACGAPAPQDMMDFMMTAASKDAGLAKQVANVMSGQRLCERFVSQKAAKWWNCSTAEARLGYLNMFSNTDFSKDVQGCEVPIMVFAGEHDNEGFRVPVQAATIGKWFKNAEIVECKNAAHYPMQETPIYLATAIEQFFTKNI